MKFLAKLICQLALLAPGVLAADYVGSNVCRGCHSTQYNAFYRNPHYKSIASGTEVPEKTGCEGCHGPGGDHIRAGGGKQTIPNAFSLMQPAKIVDTCLGCHSQSISRANIRRSEHTLNDVVCTNCHSIHSSTAPKFLLASGANTAQKISAAKLSQAPSTQRDLCYSCHTTVRAQFSMPFKHRVNEGAIECTDCHNPHGSFAATWSMSSRPRMVDQVEGNEQPCLKCHIDKRGPFVYEHAAVRVDGCATCHVAHGSTNARMLTRPVTFTLCLECHTGFSTFGRRDDGIPRQTPSHNMADPRYQNCVTCHVKIHGSNGDSFFLR
ncbi:MAG: DmsE family decaheme c-type cytochrome [Acidobacteriota bacterium]